MEIDNLKIEDILPHRYPFLLVDKVIKVDPGKKAIGVKNVSNNEPYFQGHFPGNPVMPGVLQVEALAQVGAVALLTAEGNEGKLALFTGINKFRFKKMVYPGDQLYLEVELTAFRKFFGKGEAKATVNGEFVSGGEIMFALVDQEQQ